MDEKKHQLCPTAQDRRDMMMVGGFTLGIIALVAVISLLINCTEMGQVIYIAGVGLCGASLLLIGGSVLVISQLSNVWAYFHAPRCQVCKGRTRPLDPWGRDFLYRHLSSDYRICRKCHRIYVPPGMKTPAEMRRALEREGEVFLDTRWSVPVAMTLDELIEQLGISKEELAAVVHAKPEQWSVDGMPEKVAALFHRAGLVDEAGRIDKTIMPELLSILTLRSMKGGWNSGWTEETVLMELAAADERQFLQ